jgi:DNA-binding IclR family transcriptional regulator
VLNAIREGHRTVYEISGASGLPPTTILRVSGLLRDLDLVGRLPGSTPIELLPIFQRAGADD